MFCLNARSKNSDVSFVGSKKCSIRVLCDLIVMKGAYVRNTALMIFCLAVAVGSNQECTCGMYTFRVAS